MEKVEVMTILIIEEEKTPSSEDNFKGRGCGNLN